MRPDTFCWRCCWPLVALLLLVLLLAGCAALAESVAADVDAQLRALEDWPLSVRCQAVEDAVARCRAAGLPDDCGWDGWNDRDRDAWTVGACEEKDDDADAQ